jgi:hypothetical protein
VDLGVKLKLGEDAAKSIPALQEALKAKDAAILQTRRDSAIQLALSTSLESSHTQKQTHSL